MPDPPEDNPFESETMGEDARLPWWFWPVIVLIVLVFIVGMVQK